MFPIITANLFTPTYLIFRLGLGYDNYNIYRSIVRANREKYFIYLMIRFTNKFIFYSLINFYYSGIYFVKRISKFHVYS